MKHEPDTTSFSLVQYSKPSIVTLDILSNTNTRSASK